LAGDFLKMAPKATGTKGQLKGKTSSGGAHVVPPENGVLTRASEQLFIFRALSSFLFFKTRLARKVPREPDGAAMNDCREVHTRLVIWAVAGDSNQLE
jgi:hypothetical protein